jgi:DtxR family Mn-dependent transcriptional regulator
MQTQINKQNGHHSSNGHASGYNGRLTPTRENYLRTLYQLSRSGDGVRLTDLAKAEGVRLPTARHAVNCLRELGLAAQENYGRILLTDAGRKMGREICNRFDLTRKFLIEVLGVPEKQAEREACVMEHHLDDDTLERIAAFVKHVTQCNGDKMNGGTCIVNLRNEMEDAREAI